MATDPKRPGLLETVAEGERLRTHLEGVGRLAGDADRIGLSVELAMFYGQAFGEAARAARGTLPATKVRVRLLREAVLGLAAFGFWQQVHTTLDGRAPLGPMERHWGNIVTLVLGGKPGAG